ncbi:MAG: hypothetical protein PHD15_04965 [Clostridia bacterium]|nr:hypothetical protein [Clostridia bacterium]MDD4387091.1 hypothetical protein [Clostridia bacterium]
MKKRLFIIITMVLIIITTLMVLYFDNRNNEQKNEVIVKQVEDIKEEPKEEVYVDNNPIKIGLYIKSGNEKKIITEYSSVWDAELIMGLFYAIPTNESVVSGKSFEYVWKEYWNKYSNIEKYRIGYNIKFTLNTGEVIDHVILNPDHAYLMFPKLQFYLYDDVNLIPGRAYYHVTQPEMTEKTQCTSVKLVGDKETKNIISPIELTVFTFDGEEDFEPVTGKYRGNSCYTILINRK